MERRNERFDWTEAQFAGNVRRSKKYAPGREGNSFTAGEFAQAV
jgi:hypothetical protein